MQASRPYSMPLLIIAESARAMACAAHKAGIPVYAIDHYNDQETRACTEASRQVPNNGSGFDSDRLMAAMRSLCPPDTPLTVGSGLENAPELLHWLTKDRPFYGNPPDIVERVKDPRQLFPLLDKLHIPYPQTRLQKPTDEQQWLVKPIGGSGGLHIYPYQPGNYCESSGYFQQQLSGQSHSVLFLADGERTMIVGYNVQWHNTCFINTPYLFEGIASIDNIPFQPQLADAVNRIVAATGLRGLCGMDFILNRNGFHVLEINPRPPASFELHQQRGNLFDWHLRACTGELPDCPPRRPPNLRAKAVFYVPFDIVIPTAPDWPAWTADRPLPASRLYSGEPLCSLFAQGTHSRQRIKQRQQILHQLVCDWRDASWMMMQS